MTKRTISKILPFGIFPAHWGLAGQTREIAKAEYELTGIERDIKIAEIKFSDDPRELHRRKAEIDFRYDKIDRYELDVSLLEANILDETERNIALADLNLSHNKIEKKEHEKTVATLRKEPWVSVVKIDIDKNNPANLGEVELDWNEFFIEELKNAGYQGHIDYMIVDQWFSHLCGTIAEEHGIHKDDTIDELPVRKAMPKPRRGKGKGKQPQYREYE